MRLHLYRTILQWTALGALALSGNAGASDLAGQGSHYFASASGCPLPKISMRAVLCNRIALDDQATTATVDTGTHRIHFDNTRRYGRKTIVGDVLLQGSALDEAGRRVPVGVHLILSKDGDSWSFSGHPHTPVMGRFSEVRIDPYLVDVPSESGRRVLISADQAAKLVTDPALAARLTSHLVQVRDTRGTHPGDADITIFLGAGKASKPVLRARLQGTGAADALLAQGTWSFELEALTGRIPDQVVRRELFLYGLSGQPTLDPLMQHGFASRDRLTIGAVDGRGYLRYGDRQQAFDGAADAAAAFLQQSFIGLVLGTRFAAADASAR
ncbi:hypothetical protein IP91_03394 [Pseudoduganella lurida]|uniref:DUF2125 domain-containing protein n=1 Tax=Pseudoduganella lurida TaxID=1036180 RepID=A0A562R496_9BURK|nr:hypothetical protein [Pseudoduganella lurida]TWI63424.1 hypothetical protein IP91_03394 [Pseudoduganella lurida]